MAMRNYSNFNLSSPLWTELWVDFGLPVVLVGFATLGYWARRADDWFLSARATSHDGHVRVVEILIPLLAAYEFIVLRGPLLQAMLRLAALILVCSILSERASMTRTSAVDASSDS